MAGRFTKANQIFQLAKGALGGIGNLFRTKPTKMTEAAKAAAGSTREADDVIARLGDKIDDADREFLRNSHARAQSGVVDQVTQEASKSGIGKAVGIGGVVATGAIATGGGALALTSLYTMNEVSEKNSGVEGWFHGIFKFIAKFMDVVGLSEVFPEFRKTLSDEMLKTQGPLKRALHAVNSDIENLTGVNIGENFASNPYMSTLVASGLAAGLATSPMLVRGGVNFAKGMFGNKTPGVTAAAATGQMDLFDDAGRAAANTADDVAKPGVVRTTMSNISSATSSFFGKAGSILTRAGSFMSSFRGNAVVAGGIALGAGTLAFMNSGSYAHAARSGADILGYGDTATALSDPATSGTDIAKTATLDTAGLAGGVGGFIAGAKLGAAGGAWAGGAIGTAIPIPVVGTAFGAAVGGAVGFVGGGLAASFAGSTLARGVTDRVWDIGEVSIDFIRDQALPSLKSLFVESANNEVAQGQEAPEGSLRSHVARIFGMQDDENAGDAPRPEHNGHVPAMEAALR